jgi:hypothetical protein
MKGSKMKNRLHNNAVADRARVQVEAAAEKSTALADKLLKGLTDCVVDHPKSSLVAMLSLGVLVGWFLKRR